MGNVFSSKNIKSLNQLRLDVTSQLQNYKDEYSSRNDPAMADFFDKVDLEFNQKHIENSKNKTKSSTVNINTDSNL
jgi:predicted SprT family Zn-dependent metalloprotease